MKHMLQTHGPLIPGFINNEGAPKGSIFHGHAYNSNGTLYVLEWAIIDPTKRILALTNFAKHENFANKQEPLTQQDIQEMTSNPQNINIMAHIKRKAKEAAIKVERTEANYIRI